MYHRAESPEVVRATLAEWERTVAAHQFRHEATRLLTEIEEQPTPRPMRGLIERLHRLVQPASRMRDEFVG